jgi:hypothetical protein
MGGQRVGKITSKGGAVYDGMWRTHIRNGEGMAHMRTVAGTQADGETARDTVAALRPCQDPVCHNNNYI